MIELNITLFVQMAHFLFAWWFLDAFLCKYLVQSVQEEQCVQDELSEQIGLESKQLEELKREQEKKWLQWCSRFRSAVPFLGARVHVSESFIKKGPVEGLSKEETQKTVTTIAERIAQAVLYE